MEYGLRREGSPFLDLDIGALELQSSSEQVNADGDGLSEQSTPWEPCALAKSPRTSVAAVTANALAAERATVVQLRKRLSAVEATLRLEREAIRASPPRSPPRPPR